VARNVRLHGSRANRDATNEPATQATDVREQPGGNTLPYPAVPTTPYSSQGLDWPMRDMLQSLSAGPHHIWALGQEDSVCSKAWLLNADSHVGGGLKRPHGNQVGGGWDEEADSGGDVPHLSRYSVCLSVTAAAEPSCAL
jgi:hypothetical protein